jgi:hypothetical protein
MATVSRTLFLVDSMLGHSTLTGAFIGCVSASSVLYPLWAVCGTYNGDATVTSTGMVTPVAAGIDAP